MPWCSATWAGKAVLWSWRSLVGRRSRISCSLPTKKCYPVATTEPANSDFNGSHGGHVASVEMLSMPWRIRNELLRLLASPAIHARFWLNGIQWGRGWRVFGMPIIQRHSGSQILLGDGLELRSWKQSNPLVPNHPVVLATRTAEAAIRVGNQCGFTGATL